MKRVSICIATCARNDMLARCLKSIENTYKPAEYKISVIVVDNNSKPSSKEVVSSFEGALNINYDWEPRPGIPFARNKCLEWALNYCSDFIIFIDDDEWVEHDWLVGLLLAVDQDDVDVVSGLVNQERNGKITAKKNFNGSALRNRAETDNVVFKSWIARKIKFDEDFAQTGGSDVMFFRTAFELGAKIRFSSKAVVTEEMPVARQRLEWRIQRHFRYGITHCMIEKKLAKGASSTFLIVRALALIPVGFLEMILKLILRGKVGAIEGLERIMRGIGSLSYFLGLRYNEYKRK